MGVQVVSGVIDTINVKERIEQLREAHGMKKIDLVKQIGFSRQYYHQINNLSAIQLIKVCELFNITPQQLYGPLEEFERIPIISARKEYEIAKLRYENMMCGI